MNTNASLTKRESQMVTGIVLGKCKKEIANELFISTRTVENTIYNALRKIEGKKSTELVVYWFVKHFSIPLEKLPHSITAFVFLLLFSAFEYFSGAEVIRTSKVREIECREKEARRNDEPVNENISVICQ